MEFKSLIGQKVIAIVPFIDPKNMTEMTILGVDVGGIWVESASVKSAYASALAAVGMKGDAESLSVFVPFHEIRAAFTARKYTKPSVSVL